MTRRITDIVNDGEVLGVSGGVAVSVPLPVDTDDQTAAQVPFTPAGGLSATDVQAALVELDTEKLASVDIADLTATGTPSASTYLRGDNTWSAPAGSTGPTTIDSGFITSDIACPGSTTTTVLTTGSLAIGRWKLDAQIYIDNTGGAGNVFDIKTVVGTATATYYGPIAGGAQLLNTANPRITLYVSAVVDVTAAGTLLIRIQPSTTACTAKASSNIIANTRVTGWTAVRLGDIPA